ncbi:hypothetical protein MMU55_001747 [Campylobacter jejuni]|uniref:TM2 domain-containing protein n=1 Tax=Campylobacter jejuni TaxID=197 RepID=A0A431D0E2_CAMJU|nr:MULTISPECIES: hypothetical protein [Campylobacter]ECL3536725.1 hypothetical protein [Campylobacter jejuni]ECP5951228.1 hypothetical protein [Campylobacter jejuni]ECP9363343.1 hypothetical protein [Campylobacter jejuni]EIY3538247.1 hypothetical protein [Campylobacter jejuni]EMA2810109.1 hypothetical protein [Campylobacter jejuni]
MDFNSVLSNIGDKLPRDGLAAITLKEKFERLSEERKKDVLNRLPMLKLKSPALVFWVGTFLFGPFGVGRFMIGDMVLGFVRLAFVIIPIIFNIVANESLQNIAYILALMNWIVNWTIWWIVDMFLVGKKLRKQNYEKIANIIQ